MYLYTCYDCNGTPLLREIGESILHHTCFEIKFQYSYTLLSHVKTRFSTVERKLRSENKIKFKTICESTRQLWKSIVVVDIHHSFPFCYRTTLQSLGTGVSLFHSKFFGNKKKIRPNRTTQSDDRWYSMPYCRHDFLAIKRQ